MQLSILLNYVSGTNTIAVMSGSECYESLKTGFKNCWDEINQIIDDGHIEISPGHTIPVEIFLGGDYKVSIVVHSIDSSDLYKCHLNH